MAHYNSKPGFEITMKNFPAQTKTHKLQSMCTPRIL